MKSVSTYDIRQIVLFQKELNELKDGNYSLESVYSLITVIDALESIQEKIKNDLRNDVNTLEQIISCIEDGSIKKWRGNYKIEFDQSIENLQKIASQLVDRYLMINDPNVVLFTIKLTESEVLCPKCNHSWQNTSQKAMVICPNCLAILHSR